MSVLLSLLSGYLVDDIRSGSFLRHAGLTWLQLLISRQGITADTRVENRHEPRPRQGEKVEILTSGKEKYWGTATAAKDTDQI